MHPATPAAPRETANDRFKRSTARHYWIALIGAVATHFVLFAFFPGMTIAGAMQPDDPFDVLDPLEELDLPDPPEPIQRPAVPIVGEDVDIDVTMAETVPTDEFVPIPIAPPATNTAAAGEDPPKFVPVTLHPRLLNTDEVTRRASREYPSTFRGTGLGETPVVWILIDEQGAFVKSHIHESSGIAAVDSAALRVSRMMRFSPAENRGRAVRVWVQIPIRFH